MAECVIAVDVGGTTMKGGLVSRSGRVLRYERRPTPRGEGAERVVAAVADFVDDLAAPGAHTPLAVGLAVPGLVTPERAVFSAAFGWRDVPARAFTRADLPVALGHDVRAAGAAELAYGPARTAEHVLYLPVGTGIAGALVLSGSLYGGASGWAGQIGHIPVHPDGLPCGCGQRGCLGLYASASAIAAACGEKSAADVVTRVRAGDPEAERVWARAVEALALALTTYTLLLHPTLIVIGGGLSLAGEDLLGPLRSRLTALLPLPEPPEVEVSALGVDAGLLGAALQGWRAR
ncbi:ROK family protein [Nonomuraea longicatena]|uniref:ROK family protein n=1 Tax=Nonomuraea longicatena TaxID=83682 RepID=A0ABP3Z5X5_9ACTN